MALALCIPASSSQCWRCSASLELSILQSASKVSTFSHGRLALGCRQQSISAKVQATEEAHSVSSVSTLQFDYLADQNENSPSGTSSRRYASWTEYLGARKNSAFMDRDSDSTLDSISQLHKQLENEPPMHSPLEKGDLERLNKILSEKAKRGALPMMQKLAQGAVSYTVDPEKLISGEYIVHKKVGVGQFVYMKEELPEGKTSAVKYVYLKYADGMAKLPAKQAQRLLYRFFRPGEVVKRAPKLGKLNDRSQWEKRKIGGSLDAQKRVVKMIDVYIRRLKQKRPLYSKDVPGTSGFAAKFPYTPTPDQLKAFMDVERDMTEQDTPMDRLICGDVGFGKTEVAMRAIFYAVSAKKQVMVLAPTTVLAKQHFDAIKERFSGFPETTVAILSRFQNSLEKRNVIEGINNGLLNIIVGTHALLGNQIHYENVGLLVVDEEQRFGVAQKEKIAALKATVDILTLSATPIPRTLHMALSGFRDASLITTPPPERRPITTHVCVYSKETLKNAIKTELEREGQVFYVVPRIQDMEDTEKILKSLLPEVKVSVAHGKKRPAELEEKMQKFTEGESDILLCTNIIESGLDIATVNTIIVENVHLLGLSQIYQLRGRVGRADKAAHAYLLHPRKEFLSSEALERLKALEEYCALGQGFQLAERDMAIRGIGSIFGDKQSGDCNKIGVDLYAEMLFETLSKAQYHSLPQLEYEDVQLAMEANSRAGSLNSRKWETVIDDATEAAKTGMKELVNFTYKLRKEHGKEPGSLEDLLKTIYAKRMAADLGIHHIQTRAKQITMYTKMDEKAFKTLHGSMVCEALKISLTFADGKMELQSLVELPTEWQLERLFLCLADLRHGLPSFLTYR